MKSPQALWISVAFVLIAAGAAVWLYPALPAQVPTHWDLHGRIDGYHARQWAVVFAPLLIALLALMARVLPALAPRRYELEPFAGAWHLVMLAAQGVVLAAGLAILLRGAGHAVPVPAVAMLAVGALLMVIGNYMGKLRRNFFIGIRTPWTLSSDAAWERTHRLGGRLFVLAGLVAVLGTLLRFGRWLPLACIAAAALGSVGYSFVLYRRLERRR
ncbi:SdpI family protein [Frateuria defendens]|uniref:SdpI family protein n=1 Tax=Frateuria defendens TaxID=2219559 RepID=UPI00066FB31F|nr:SdpI family protein [Frateuria defendens]